ncbi:MAG TPA: S-layer protein [Methanoregulaceae archaeon]|nr:S-layer protein [Methanoregulaceae archaeon]
MSFGRSITILTIFIMLLGIAGPVLAGERYLSGGPNLTAAIVGPNDFSPGDEVSLPVAIQNSGLLQYVFTYPNQITAADLPNSAKLMTVTLDPGNSPLIIKSDPQMVGDLPGGQKLVVNFKVKIPEDTAGDTYTLPLTVQYTFLAHADQYGTDALQYFYQTSSAILDLPVKIRQEVIPEIESVQADKLNAGTQGYLNISLKNIGNLNGTETTVQLIQNGNSPVVPVASSVYIGDFPEDAIIPLNYKVSISKDAVASSYPVNLTVTYKNADGTVLTSAPLIIGVPVSGKIDFIVVSPPPQFNSGTEKTMKVTYMNTGTAKVYGAEAQLFTVDPFTTTGDTSYLGDMSPGDTRDAYFDITVNSNAIVKEYALDSEIRYRDALNNDQVSDKVKVPIQVVGLSGLMLIIGTPYGILLIVLVIIAVVYLIVTRRKKGKNTVAGKP